jgi:hypothetical protein
MIDTTELTRTSPRATHKRGLCRPDGLIQISYKKTQIP